MKKLLFWLSVVLVMGTVSAACEIDADKQAASGNYRIGFKTEPAEVAAGEEFTLALTACHQDGQPFTGAIKASAIMPAHNHGMNYQPTVEMLKPGQFSLKGYLFHMPGHWQHVFELNEQGNYETLRIDHQL